MPGSVGQTLFAKTGNIDKVVSDTSVLDGTEMIALGFTKSGGGNGFLIADHQTGANAVDVGSAKTSAGYPNRISRYMFTIDCFATNIPAGGSKSFCFKDGDKLGESELEKALGFINYTTTSANLLVKNIIFDAGAIKLDIDNIGASDFPGQLRLVMDFCPKNIYNDIEV